MPITAVLFDLDDTLLWDDRSVEEAFRAACEAAGNNVDPHELEAAVRKEPEVSMNLTRLFRLRR